MAGELNHSQSDIPGNRPHTGSWIPGHLMPAPPHRSGRTLAFTALAIATIGLLLAAAALMLTIIRSTTTASSSTSLAPSYSNADVAAAQQQLCDTYKLAARAVGVDTNGNNPAFARIALTNAAAMLDSVDTIPALVTADRDAARALATAYRTVTAKSSSDAFTEPEYRAALDDVKAKDTAMRKICSGS